MKLVIIFGPQAVGKMTVGHALEQITDLKLFHNHMTIEFVAPFFDYGSITGRKLVDIFREKIFEEVAKSDLAGLIFTCVWNFDSASDREYIERLCSIFTSRNGSVYFVELEADLKTRVGRNSHPHRLYHKPSKRDLARSLRELQEATKHQRLNSKEGEIQNENYLRIDNTILSPEDTAIQIKRKFQL
jgi:hypothetical protein